MEMTKRKIQANLELKLNQSNRILIADVGNLSPHRRKWSLIRPWSAATVNGRGLLNSWRRDTGLP